jgi:hypothetical protein
MKGPSMSAEWMTVQQFISAQGVGVFEVELETKSKQTRCNCPVWNKKSTCKHTSFVNNKIKNTGHYSINVPNSVPEEWAYEASEDPQKFREFVVNYATIEVI